MKNSKAKDLETRNCLNTLKKDEMLAIRGGDNSDRPADGDPKDEVFE